MNLQRGHVQDIYERMIEILHKKFIPRSGVRSEQLIEDMTCMVIEEVNREVDLIEEAKEEED